MKLEYIEALGHFLAYYETDLKYFANFKKFRTGKLSFDDYFKKVDRSFSNFIAEFKVARNIPKNSQKEYLVKTMEWLNENPIAVSVDDFAEYMKQTTHGKVMTSLCSKVLMLNAPHLIIPIDTYGRNALDQKVNQYSAYNQKVRLFKTENQKTIEELINKVIDYILEIENKFKDVLEHITEIRELRLTDKMLWCTGKKK